MTACHGLSGSMAQGAVPTRPSPRQDRRAESGYGPCSAQSVLTLGVGRSASAQGIDGGGSAAHFYGAASFLRLAVRIGRIQRVNATGPAGVVRSHLGQLAALEQQDAVLAVSRVVGWRPISALLVDRKGSLPCPCLRSVPQQAPSGAAAKSGRKATPLGSRPSASASRCFFFEQVMPRLWGCSAAIV